MESELCSAAALKADDRWKDEGRGKYGKDSACDIGAADGNPARWLMLTGPLVEEVDPPWGHSINFSQLKRDICLLYFRLNGAFVLKICQYVFDLFHSAGFWLPILWSASVCQVKAFSVCMAEATEAAALRRIVIFLFRLGFSWLLNLWLTAV